MPDYWIYRNGIDTQTPLAEVDLIIRPMVGEEIWIKVDEVSYRLDVTEIAHVLESEEDDARIQVTCDVVEAIHDEQEEAPAHRLCSNCTNRVEGRWDKESDQVVM